MDELYASLIILALFLILDLAVLAARTAFQQTNHARLLNWRDLAGDQIQRAVSLLTLLPRLQASLDLALAASHFLLAGAALALIRFNYPTLQWYLAIASLMGIAFGLFLLEWTVNRAVTRSPERWAIRMATFARLLLLLLSPLTAIPLAFSGETRDISDADGSVTHDELKSLVDAGEEEGLFEQEERRMIYSIFQLAETRAREIMVPRIDMLTLEVNTPLQQAINAFVSSGHSRVPVYEETIEHTLGVLYAKDLLRTWREGSQIDTLRSLLRPAYFVPEAKRVDELLAEMQSQRIHIAIVVDEYGGVAGIVTLEDIVEEILGEIQDEYDQGEESPFLELEDGGYLFLGRVDLDDFNEELHSDISKEDAETLGGYIYKRLGRVPMAGEQVRKGDLLLTVEQVSGRRIRKVRANWSPVNTAAEEEKNDSDE